MFTMTSGCCLSFFSFFRGDKIKYKDNYLMIWHLVIWKAHNDVNFSGDTKLAKLDEYFFNPKIVSKYISNELLHMF